MWLTDPDADPVTDISFAWIQKLVDGQPYILADLTVQDLYWSSQFAERWGIPLIFMLPGPKGEEPSSLWDRFVMWLGGKKPEPLIPLWGCTDPAILKHHGGGPTDGWWAGLLVFVLGSPEEIGPVLLTWSGKPWPPDTSGLPVRFSVEIYADAIGFILRPGRVGMSELKDLAERTARELGYDWRPLRFLAT